MVGRGVLALFEHFDVYLTPVMGMPPPPIGWIDTVGLEPREVNRRQAQAFPFTPPFNMSGQPAINVPVEWTDAGLPVGIQLVAGYGREDVLLRVAGQLEAAKPWAHRTPEV